MPRSFELGTNSVSEANRLKLLRTWDRALSANVSGQEQARVRFLGFNSESQAFCLRSIGDVLRIQIPSGSAAYLRSRWVAGKSKCVKHREAGGRPGLNEVANQEPGPIRPEDTTIEPQVYDSCFSSA
jgi:hypothetical protein